MTFQSTFQHISEFCRKRQSYEKPEIHLMASTYIGFLIFTLCLIDKKWKDMLKPLSKVILIIGVGESLQFIDRTPMYRIIISILAHALIYGMALGGTTTLSSHMICLSILCGILMIYLVSTKWPYTSPPLVLIGVSLTVWITELLVDLT